MEERCVVSFHEGVSGMCGLNNPKSTKLSEDDSDTSVVSVISDSFLETTVLQDISVLLF